MEAPSRRRATSTRGDAVGQAHADRGDPLRARSGRAGAGERKPTCAISSPGVLISRRRARQEGVLDLARPFGFDPSRPAVDSRAARSPTTESQFRNRRHSLGRRLRVRDAARAAGARGGPVHAETKALARAGTSTTASATSGTRYRYRELDCWPTRRRATCSSSATRSFWRSRMACERQFAKIETPAGPASLAVAAVRGPFTTNHNALDRDLYMRISVEACFSTCIVAGCENVYEHGQGLPATRGISPRHSRSCTIIEFM